MLKYHIITFGCQMNKSDSERIATILENKAYQPASDINEADLIVVNMCSVRQSAVDRVFGISQKLYKLKCQKPNVKTILTGCILKEDRKRLAEKFDSIVDKEKYLRFPQKFQNLPIVYIPISNGCNNACSYCVVPFTRGRLVCRNHRDVTKEIKDALQKGAKEIWLLGQNVNDYKSNVRCQSQNVKTVNFAGLLKMVNKIPGNFKFFFTSPHPKNFSDELINTLAECEKFGKYLNLPVQSGDNKILKRMNRNYTVKDYINLVKEIRKKMPEIKLSTDIIVGFPGETEKQFQNTAKLLKEIKFNWAYIAKYSPRPGTAVFKLKDDVPWTEKKRREKILREIINENT